MLEINKTRFFLLQYIEGLKSKDVRIIIFTSYEFAARAVICEAYRQVCWEVYLQL